MESKSAIKLARSYGLLRYKVVSSLPLPCGCGIRRDVLALRRLRTQLRKLRNVYVLPRWGAACCTPTNCARRLIGCFCDCGLLAVHQFHVLAERLQLADKHVERFRYAWLNARLAFDDGLVDLRATVHVVRLRG